MLLDKNRKNIAYPQFNLDKKTNFIKKGGDFYQ